VGPWPSGTVHAFDSVRDAELAGVLNKTEFMIVRFYQKGHLTLRLGQLLFEMLRHPEFDIREVRSESIVSLHRLLESPFENTVIETYNWLDCFREIMRNPEFKKHFDLIFRPVFDASVGRLIGPACTGFWWERIQKKLGSDAAVGAAQLYFDETFQKKSQGVDTGSVS